MHADPISRPAVVQGAAQATQQAPSAAQQQGAAGQDAAPAQDAAQLRQAAQDAQQDAQQAAQQAQDAAGFRIEGGDGKIITVGPDGIQVTAGQAAPTPDLPVIPTEAVIISLAFFAMLVLIVIGWPIARAIARRMDRATVTPPRASAENTEQLRRIEQAVEAMAIEVERVSENQRFVTKLLSETRPDGLLQSQAAGANAQPERVAPVVNPSR